MLVLSVLNVETTPSWHLICGIIFVNIGVIYLAANARASGRKR